MPNANDNVTINTGHTLTIPNGQIAGAGTLNDKGILRNFGTLNMGKFSTTDLYNQSMSYHIRGGLRGINLDANNNLTNALFSMKLSFEDDQIYFDGNIRKQEWKTSLDNVTRSFTYRYDGASRIKAGVYSGTGGENYTLADVNYDNNGNIKKLIRNGLITTNTFGIVDNLNYTYNANSNKILKVDDLSNVTASFTDVAGNDYAYSADGSLIKDANKGITSIEYNYLKLPKKITKGGTDILYQYDASGKKLKETIGTQVTDYVGNIIYKNGVLYQIGHDEGRVVNGIYEYDIKDHLGSLRVSFKDSLGIAKITQSNSYGIWGEELPSLSYKNTPNLNNYKFTDKENLPQTGYTDFGARFYDNLVPRFITIDPLGELMTGFSPYSYCFDNPVSFFDDDGMVPLPMIIRFTSRGRRVSLTPVWNPAHKKFRPHKGVDLRTGGQTGLDVSAAADGVVEKIGWDRNGWGRYVIIRHENGYYSLYAHLLKNGVAKGLTEGKSVSNGQPFALSGNTGGSTAPHLHLEFRRSRDSRGFKRAEILDPYAIDDLQVLIDEEDDDKPVDTGFIKPKDISFGNSSLPSFKLPSITNINTDFGLGQVPYVNSTPNNSSTQETKKKSESTPVTGAHD